MRARTLKRGRLVAAVAAVSVLPMLISPPMSIAGGGTSGAPIVPVSETTGSYLLSTTKNSDRKVTISVHSAAMGRNIPLEIILPADTSAPRPTLYLLNGAGGGEDSATWQRKTDVMEFFNEKNINVVTPLEGAFSYYTDWVNDDPNFGRQKWQTFLTKELPPVIDAAFNTNKVQSIAAISMTATSVLNLAIAAPGLYKSVGSYSGCAETSTPLGQTAIQLVVGVRGNTDVSNMWGPLDGPGWVVNDPVVNAEKLRGTELYVSTGSGLPGPHDTLANPAFNGDAEALANQIIIGGIIETPVNHCTHNLAYRLKELNVPATFDFKPAGTHSWAYWRDDLRNSWPMIARSMGI